MTEKRLSATTFWLAAIETTVCLGFGVLHPFLVDSLFAFDRAPRTAAALIGLGALAGGLGLVETIVVPLPAVTLAALCVTRLRTREEVGRRFSATSASAWRRGRSAPRRVAASCRRAAR